MMIGHYRHFATAFITSTSFLAALPTYKGWLWFFIINHHLMVCDVNKWLHNVPASFALHCWLLLVSRWVHMSTGRVIQASLRCVYNGAAFSCSAVVLTLRWMVLWLFRPLTRPSVHAHSIRELTLALSDDLKWLFVLDKEGWLFTVRRGICNSIDTCDRLIRNCAFIVVTDTISVID